MARLITRFPGIRDSACAEIVIGSPPETSAPSCVGIACVRELCRNGWEVRVRRRFVWGQPPPAVRPSEARLPLLPPRQPESSRRTPPQPPDHSGPEPAKPALVEPQVPPRAARPLLPQPAAPAATTPTPAPAPAAFPPFLSFSATSPPIPRPPPYSSSVLPSRMPSAGTTHICGRPYFIIINISIAIDVIY